MYELRIYKQADRGIKRLPRKYQKAIIEAFDEIREDPFFGKPLVRGLAGKLSYKVGVYRIIYKVNKVDKIISVLTVGHRGRVYE